MFIYHMKLLFMLIARHCDSNLKLLSTLNFMVEDERDVWQPDETTCSI